MSRVTPNGSYCNPEAALVPSRASNSSNSSSASRTARSLRFSGVSPRSTSNASWNSFTASLGFMFPPLVSSVHPVVRRRASGHRELNTLTTLLRLERSGHLLHQIVTAFLEPVLRNREHKGVVNERLNGPHRLVRQA